MPMLIGSVMNAVRESLSRLVERCHYVDSEVLAPLHLIAITLLLW